MEQKESWSAGNQVFGSNSGSMFTLSFTAGGLFVGILAGRSWAVSRALAGSPDLWGLGIGFYSWPAFFLLRLYEKNLKRENALKQPLPLL